jgi:hypothetical protein
MSKEIDHSEDLVTEGKNKNLDLKEHKGRTLSKFRVKVLVRKGNVFTLYTGISRSAGKLTQKCQNL